MDVEPGNNSLFDIAKDIDIEVVFPEISKLSTSPGFYLKYIIHLWKKSVRENLVDFDLTDTQFELLASLIILTKKKEIITQTDLTNNYQADKTVVSEVLRILERKGYIIREKHPKDKRAKSLVVTDNGLEIFMRAAKQAVKIDDQFFSVLGDDKDEFIRMLKKFL